mmetsp:Transcript_68348/g.154617  ORF Transcript_68348/g.154617 Transcript_68348/m.154617 type:complete len:84 (-) Transcript_68348:303-554(-)
MPCQTCGGSGHNTTSCDYRKNIEWFATKGCGQLAGATVSGSVCGLDGYVAGCVANQVTQRAVKPVVHEAMMTKAQIAYRNSKK